MDFRFLFRFSGAYRVQHTTLRNNYWSDAVRAGGFCPILRRLGIQYEVRQIAMLYHHREHGWTLEAGGLIARTVRGWPDEHAHRGFLYQAQQHDVGDYAQGTPQQQYEWYDAMAEGCLDAELDLLYFNCRHGRLPQKIHVRTGNTKRNKLLKQWNLNRNHCDW